MSDSFTQSTSPSFCYCLQSLHEWLQPCCYDAGDDVLSLIVHIAQFHPSVLSDWLPLLLTNPEIQRIVMEYITDSTSPTNWRERIGTERMLVEQTWSRWMEDVDRKTFIEMWRTIWQPFFSLSINKSNNSEPMVDIMQKLQDLYITQ